MIEKEVVVSSQDIARRVKELGRAISRDYSGRKLVMVGILNGAFIFLADLVREIELPIEIDFIRVSSYGSSTCSSGTIQCTKDTELELEGKDVLLVEDIVDTGKTIACLRQLLVDRKAASVGICALIDKRERRAVEVAVDYAGFTVAEGFLVGYGLDHAEQHRQYPAIYKIVSPV
ncbi:hypoxanthine phosphoribosyltransferase [Thiovibrio frasassiensis]|jgi:hypoxanthine phosphoribosyltransferase|uniref:Hypoxanthine phosphoribosyltransferase n=1 Tax=Thiovibrio frasassiensis TaxID=2984131 RepID=A0A9X4MGS2_9BACT|nr:hypoxanthine phosphoribosyltransferase [Thiovibrio frasassiensis]MDG4475228.1 hypoxanthine phosphoribosyltransferase [Thiovibrio frasassiensis]